MSESRKRDPEEKLSEFGASFKQVFKKELDCVERRWQTVYPADPKPDPDPKPTPKNRTASSKIKDRTPTTDNELVGLAFSGGGIRSATINMGIAQALHRRGVFDHVDYMSTVSGGGYLGSSISTAMRALPTEEEAPKQPKTKGEFPYAYQELNAAADTTAVGEPRQVETKPLAAAEKPAVGEPRKVETKFLTWVRNNSNYMATGGFLDWPRIFGVLLRGILANFLVLLPILLLLAVGMVWRHGDKLAKWEQEDQKIATALHTASEAATEADQRLQLGTTNWTEADEALKKAEQAAKTAKEEQKTTAEGRAATKIFLWVMGFAGVFLTLVFVFPVLIRVYKVYKHKGVIETGEESSVDDRGNVEKAFGIVLVLIFVAAALEALPLLIRWFHKMETSGLRGLVAGAGSGGALAVFTVAGKLLSSLGGLKQKIVLLLVGLLGLFIPLAVALYVVDDMIYPVAGITAAQDSALADELADMKEKGIDIEPAVEGPTPAYLVKEWGHKPLKFGAMPSPDEVVRLLPGVLLLILGGGLGAAAAGKLPPTKARPFFAFVGIVVGVFVGYCILIGSSASLAWICGMFGFAGTIRPDVLVLGMTVVVMVYCWAAIDVNLTGMLGLYRDRLASAYLIGLRKKKGEDGKPTGEDEIFVEPDLNLEDLCGGTPPAQKPKKKEDCPGWDGQVACHSSKAPYHIVNTALNLQGSKDPMLRDRGSDFFMFSKLYYGGHRTGYCPTGLLEKVFPQMDLPTAMAISAAAASPNAGRATSKPLVALMTLLNIRLGYWVPHPGRLYDWLDERGMIADNTKEPQIHHRWSWRIPPSALLLEMAGEVNERDKWVNLSDGGHMENLAVYELLRRRCKYIICGDGEADPTLTFGGLAILMRSARIDMGIEIEILLDDLRLGEDRTSHQHAALGRILYPSEHQQVRRKDPGTCPVCGKDGKDKDLEDFQNPKFNKLDPSEVSDDTKYRCPRGELEIGHLLYIKSSFTGNEDETMQEYRAKSPDFPHESTADQFFDEGQFESYRALGFHMADGLFPAVKPGEKVNTCDTWECFTDWFDALSTDLAPRLSAKHEALQDQLRRISEMLQKEEFHEYFYELYPSFKELEKAKGKAAAKDDTKKQAGMQQIAYLVGLQLDLMETAFLSLDLDQPVNWNHPGNQGWRQLFEGWAKSQSFRSVYVLLKQQHSGRFQNFCSRSLRLKMTETELKTSVEKKLKAMEAKGGQEASPLP